MLRKAPMNQSLAGNFLQRCRNTGNRYVRKAGRFPNNPIPRIFSKERYSVQTAAGAFTGSGRNAKRPGCLPFSLPYQCPVQRKRSERREDAGNGTDRYGYIYSGKELAVALGMSLPLFQLEARQKQEKDKLKAQMSTQRQEIEKKRLLDPRTV